MESNIPEELLQEILLRSPVKSLLRFKCVCKSWLSLICDPSFAKSHFELSAAPSHRLLLKSLSASDREFIDVDVSFHDDSAVVSLPESPLFHFGFVVLGSCRGFLLFMERCSDDLYIWNPSNGVHRRISYSDNILGSCFELRRPFHRTLLIGFGFDPSTDDYLVVVLSLVREGTHMDMLLFSLRTNSWEKIQISHIRYMYISNYHGLSFNGAIHWLVFPGRDPPKIIVFDLIEKQLSEISLPDIGDFNNHLFGNLVIMGGCLCVWYNYFGLHKIQVWLMKQYKVQSSWTMFEIPDRKFSYICSPKGVELVAVSDEEGLVKFNAKGELLEIHRKSDNMIRCQPAFYTQSLLSLPGDCCENMETQPTKTNKKN